MKILAYSSFDGIPTIRDSEIRDLYRLMEQDETAKAVFYDGFVRKPDDFLDLMKRPDIFLFVAYDYVDPVGIGWLSNVECQTARAHFCVFSKAWGESSVDVGKRIIETAFAATDLEMLIGHVPKFNHMALKFACKCGAKVLGELPFGGIDAGELCPVTIVYYKR